jgi:hypothetical protein
MVEASQIVIYVQEVEQKMRVDQKLLLELNAHLVWVEALRHVLGVRVLANSIVMCAMVFK